MSRTVVEKGNSILLETKEGEFRAVSYDDLVRAAGIKKSTSRRSKNAGTKFSRMVALAEHAVRTGTWTTGAPIEVQSVLGNLMDSFEVLHLERDIPNITDVAVKKLTAIASSAKVGDSKTEMVNIINTIVEAKNQPCV